MNPHVLAELRSLSAHVEIAKRIVHDPSIVTRALERLERDHALGITSDYYYTRWRDALAGPTIRLTELLCSEHEEAVAMRQASPFAGTLSPNERWALWKNVRQAFERGTLEGCSKGTP